MELNADLNLLCGVGVNRTSHTKPFTDNILHMITEIIISMGFCKCSRLLETQLHN